MARVTSEPIAAAQHILRPDAILTSQSDNDFPGWPGAYALLIRLEDAATVRFSGSQEVLGKGWYAYAGSAHGPGGTGARIRRHMHKDKKPHWHVDTLTLAADCITALALRDGDECDIAMRLGDSGSFRHVLPGFGRSDCAACLSHLLVWTDEVVAAL